MQIFSSGKLCCSPGSKGGQQVHLWSSSNCVRAWQHEITESEEFLGSGQARTEPPSNIVASQRVRPLEEIFRHPPSQQALMLEGGNSEAGQASKQSPAVGVAFFHQTENIAKGANPFVRSNRKVGSLNSAPVMPSACIPLRCVKE